MPQDVRTCPLCDSDRSASFDQREFRGRSVANRICLNCGLVYQSPRMTDAELELFYTEEYRLLYEGSASPIARNIADQRGRAQSLHEFSRPVIHTLTRHLDIGCSLGLLLKQFQENYGCQSIGIEPGEAHRAQGLKEGLSIFPSLEELEKQEKGRFELISMAHVLEHLPDPAGYLAHLRETLLDSDGWLLLEVPNHYAHDSFEIAHLISYSHHTLVQTVEKAGFEIVKIEHGRPRSALLPLYITLLARPASSKSLTWSLHPEKRVALKRQLGMLRRRVLERLFPNQTWLA